MLKVDSLRSRKVVLRIITHLTLELSWEYGQQDFCLGALEDGLSWAMCSVN